MQKLQYKKEVFPDIRKIVYQPIDAEGNQVQHSHVLVWTTGAGQDSTVYEKLIERGKFRVPQGIRIVLLWPVKVKYTYPQSNGDMEGFSWYDFSLESKFMNFEQSKKSALIINDHIKEELKLLNNDYKKLILSGFSGGNITNFYVLFDLIQDQIGMMFGMSSFISIELAERIIKLAETNEYKKAQDKMRNTQIYSWYGDKDPFYLDLPNKELMERVKQACHFEENFHLIEENGLAHRVSYKGLDYFHDLILIAIGFIIRQLLFERIDSLKRYVYFRTPLNDIRQLRDCFVNNELSGTYFLDKNSINQPLLLVKFYDKLNNLGGKDDSLTYIKLFLSLVDILAVSLQCLIFKHSFEVTFQNATKKHQDDPSKMNNKLESGRQYLWLFIIWAIFNPLSLLQAPVFNLQIINHFMITLVIYMNLKHKKYSQIQRDLIQSIALYVDPTLLYAFIPLVIIRNILFYRNLISTLQSITIQMTVLALLIFSSGDVSLELRNYKNILFVSDHSENLGFFWYIFVESEQTQERKQRILHTAIVIIFYVNLFQIYVLLQFKIELYQYPTLFDFNMILMIVFSFYKILRHVEGLIIIAFGFIYCMQNVLYLWITWVERFSGNANFFYFQTIVYNAFLTIAFIQLFQSLNTKAKKFQKLALKAQEGINVKEVKEQSKKDQ
ncbi:phospholipase carboxylesterase family protein [Stylonychia lemnae]|uniref:Phospholipase carboxylesterase family protein n=1 Tax=Stylonychia lemnae TaxID=5949 RepID=A0A078ARM6_STYLE|nr:phospholipase carboxylesterase family protein [Stylonychia lemnae]|eukprot:CDW83503.1 phospholipase carboxylesterase family protein [Stylonychia lemnae]